MEDKTKSAASKGNKDFSFTDAEVKRWLDEDEAAKEGFCGKRWKSDFVLDGLRKMAVGKRFDIGGKTYVLTRVGKGCYEDCPLRQRIGRSCPLASGVAFGEMLESGE